MRYVRRLEASAVTVLLIEPHMDDAVLFASYTILGEKPIVCTALAATTDGERRRREHDAAMDALGVVGRDRLLEHEHKPAWVKVRGWMEDLRAKVKPTLVYVPAFEYGGHEQHNEVNQIAKRAFDCEILSYMTYVRGGRRSRGSIEVEPEHGWSARKFQAMACYASQIEWIHTRPWFAADDALREWLA